MDFILGGFSTQRFYASALRYFKFLQLFNILPASCNKAEFYFYDAASCSANSSISAVVLDILLLFFFTCLRVLRWQMQMFYTQLNQRHSTAICWDVWRERGRSLIESLWGQSLWVKCSVTEWLPCWMLWLWALFVSTRTAAFNRRGEEKKKSFYQNTFDMWMWTWKLPLQKPCNSSNIAPATKI